MKKIGLVGEAPHDTRCIEVVLSKIFPDFTYLTLLNNIHGSQLDQQQPTKRLLRIEYELKKPDLVVIIRDLDSLHSDRNKKKQRLEIFNAFKSIVDKKAIFLLNIYEIEALILADIEKFGSLYNCAVPEYDDPSGVIDPKGELKKISKRYNEVKNLELFHLLDIDKLIAKCSYFKDFLKKFEKAVA
ncbi:DUF4276 family protein [Mucilaginibacter sp. SMC90]|uniref:DUF4276 family protein n=1 Tax=Mucilaginibacter sp. SMC90 TaxID=2929803 RepID=UPI001FB45F5C|nr:DUF4276 family protein [Mucilaginibacter sp. SMC90]UOE48040.1 DUF4276 family protein [Mucilaginibacter sp. SMC90]